jgi:hypothetical protein
MGGTLRDRCRASARPLLLAVLVALTWLIWGAGTANAAPADPDPLVLPSTQVLLEQSDTSTLEEIAASLTRVVTDPPPAVPRPVAAVPLPITTTATVLDNVDAVLSEPIDVIATVSNQASPVLTETVGVVRSVVDSVAPALPGTPIPAVALPSVPVPAVPLPAVSLPAIPLPLLEPATPGTAPVTGEPASAQPAVVAEQAPVDATSPDLRNIAGAQQSARRGFSPQQIVSNAPALRALAVTAGHVVSSAPPPSAPHRDELLRLAALQSQSGSASSGSGSAGAGAAADVAGFWSPLQDGSGARMPNAAQILAESPSFDPGSSPD